MASIIIPSRDRPDLLEACLASLSATRPANYEVIIVDNGSIEPRTRDLYAKLQRDQRIRLIDSPGAFNFSLLCNRGAAAARAPVLVFLNNDTIVVRDDWLAVLVDWALRDEVGAIGAKLLYPSRRVQHAGVVFGPFGMVAHSDVGAGSAEQGYLRRLISAREVSAVTGACLAVAKAKFDSVSGFDADAFPVDLNDIDLCLRLAERGWKALLAPEAILIHRESATRGRAKDYEVVYRHEIAHFRLRWQARINDDPYFHPCLALNAYRAMLG